MTASGTSRLLVPTLLLGALLGLAQIGVGTGASWAADAPKGDPVEIGQANVELITLTKQLDSSKTQNEDLLESLEAVSRAYHNLVGPTDLPADANEEQKKAHEAEKAKFEAAAAKFRKDAEKAFLDAFTLVRINRKTEQNDREDVNIKAAQVIGLTKNVDLAGKLQGDIENKLMKAKHQITNGLWEAAFAALAQVADAKTVTWLTKEFTHTKNSPPEAVDQLVAAHKSIPMYAWGDEKIGKLRYDLAEKMITAYSSAEANAEQSKTDPKKQSAKVFWDRIRTDTIRAVQIITKEPKTEDGQMLSMMKEFQDWMRDHKKESDEVWKTWKEEKPADKPADKPAEGK
jgi:hypothetical protein